MLNFLDLKYTNNKSKDRITIAIQKVISNNWFILGEEVRQFETEFAAFCDTRHAIGVATGLDALEIVLKAWIEMGLVSSGDEVLVPGNTFIASVLAVINAGLKPVLVEPNAENYLIDAKNIEERISKKTKVLMPVHLYGTVVSENAVYEIAKKFNLLVLEDAAQSHGARINNLRCGAVGDAAGFSFYPGKNLGAFGDGGAITTNCDELAAVARKIANYGSSEKYVHDVLGTNSRLDEIQAAILRVKLTDLDELNDERRAIAKFYHSEINNELVKLPKFDSINEGSVWHLYVVCCSARKALQDYLAKHCVSSGIHYPIALTRQNALTGVFDKHLPISDKLAEEVLSLPLYPGMDSEAMRKVVDVVNAFKL